MSRLEPAFPGGPLVADVHPDEVASWQQQGWLIDAPNAAAPPVEESVTEKQKPTRPKSK